MLRRTKKPLKREEEIPQEGDLYRRIECGGCTFELYYGYYEECDRKNPLVLPVPIYPDFVSQPRYDKEGRPFATEMQDACEQYVGHSIDEGCYSCKHYRHAVDYIGICTCEERRLE